MTEIDKEFRPGDVEARWCREWDERALFVAGKDPAKTPFTMVIPPPNVTGSLHIGHVFEHTLHDVMARFRRMQGFDVLWLPGTDHAGIATQMLLERALEKEGTSRHALGREAFLERAWEWKRTYAERIRDTLRRLGASCDWTRERFTLDDGLSRAVRTVFVRLHRDGLIYRDWRIVNWCPRCRTAISDLESVHETVVGKLWTIRYPGVDGPGLTVATTRPETMLGDTAVAVSPDDPRYRDLVGTEVVLPLLERRIPVLADPFVDPKFGTGAVKVTPAHDPNDFAMGQRHGLPQITVIGVDGRMTQAAGPFAGLDRFEARERVLEELGKRGLLVATRDHEHAVGHCQRCGTVVEPLLSRQWFVRIAPIAAPAIEAVESGRTDFVPESWSKTYFEWMRNIHDWCISRQLWWGHRIPAWYCDACETVVVAEEAPAECGACGGAVRQDEDVLDTWFSSALWPFSTLGWPDETADLARYYPTSLLITGFDIIFFWVARMLMMGLRFRGEVPFRHVYIHGLVRDAEGQKMSKTKGNTIEPSEVQERYGTDAVRFTLAILAAPGNDIPLSAERMDGYRAFVNKLWNASRFVLLRMGDRPKPRAGAPRSLVDRWILSRAHRVTEEATRALEEYRFDRAADALYHFVWHEFCDWYIEMVKPAIGAGPEDERAEAAVAVLVETLDVVLRLLHPFVPFVTEELWQRIPHEGPYLATASWPRPDPALVDADAEREMEVLQAVVVRIRSLRAESNVDAARRIEVILHGMEPGVGPLLERERGLLATLARASKVEVVDRIDPDLLAARGVTGSVEIAIPLGGLLDVAAERTRLARELAKIDSEVAERERKLGNARFVERAPAEVVQKERDLQRELLARRSKVESTLSRLGGGGSA